MMNKRKSGFGILFSTFSSILLKYTFAANIVVIVCLALFGPSSQAEPLANYVFRMWQSQDGLPENTVQALARTADGFLWIGTSGGLARFDGQRFEVFDHSNTPAFKESSVLCLLVSQDGTLWIGTDGGGLLQLKNDVFRGYSGKQGLEDVSVRSLFEDKDGVLWVGTDRGLFRQRGGAAGDFEKNMSLGEINIQAITQDPEGRIWLGGRKLYLLDHGVVQRATLPAQQGESNVKALCRTRDGSIWIGGVLGLARRVPGQSRLSRVPEIQGTVTSLAEAADGTLWIGTIGEGLFYKQDGVISRLNASESLPTNAMLALFEDHNQSLWIGTQSGLLRRFRSPVHIVHLPQRSNSDFATVYLDTDGSLWAASRKLFHIQNNVAEAISFPELKGATVRNVLRDQANTLWLGTNGNGVFHFTPHGVMHYTVKDGLANDFIRIMMQAPDGSLWFGTDDGVSHLFGGHFRNFGVADGLCYPVIQAIVAAPDKDVWIGTSHGMSHIHNDRFIEDVVTRTLKSEKVWSIYLTPDGSPWIGTRNGGLFGYENKRLMHFTSAQGLGSDSIYKILGNRAEQLWLSGPAGVWTISLKQLRAQADDTQRDLFPHFYYIADGKESVQFYGGMQSGGAITPQGEVWFPSDHGPVKITPNENHAMLPRLRIVKATADGKQTLNTPAIALSADSASLEIAYSPILLAPEVGMRYRYKLEGLDKSWTNAVSRRTAYFTNIPAGTYLFRVQGYDTDLPNEYAEASVPISKRRHLYRTPWFIGAMVLLLAVVLWSGHIVKVRRVNRQFRAILEERSRLAREMHDTVLQGCASVSSLLEASASAEAEPQLRQALVDYARDQISITMDEARRAVWNLRYAGAPQTNLQASIAELAERMSKEFGIPIQLDFGGETIEVDSVTMHEITMVAREALYNALTHSHAERIGISANCAAERIILSISDNGRGFAAEQASPQGHYGMTGMRERVDRLSGTLHVQTEAGKGTCVEFRIPLHPKGSYEAA